MVRTLLALTTLVASAVVAAPAVASEPEGRQLEATVGPGFTISVTEDGQP